MLLSEPGKVIRCADHLQVLLALPAETIDLILAAPGKQEIRNWKIFALKIRT